MAAMRKNAPEKFRSVYFLLDRGGISVYTTL